MECVNPWKDTSTSSRADGYSQLHWTNRIIDPTSLSSRYEVSTPVIKGTFTDGAFIISIYATEWFTSVPFSEDWHNSLGPYCIVSAKVEVPYSKRLIHGN